MAQMCFELVVAALKRLEFSALRRLPASSKSRRVDAKAVSALGYTVECRAQGAHQRRIPAETLASHFALTDLLTSRRSSVAHRTLIASFASKSCTRRIADRVQSI